MNRMPQSCNLRSDSISLLKPSVGLKYWPSYLKGLPVRRSTLIKEGCRRKLILTPKAANDLTEAEDLVLKIFNSEKEQSRKYRRTVFGHEDWFRHRSTNRYKRHLGGLLGSRIVRGLATPLTAVVMIALSVTLYEQLREQGSLPPWCIRLAVDTSQPISLTSFALSLLLVFRTNASYARWNEARKIWGGVVNRSRDITRQGLTWISPEKAALKDMLQRWVTAFPFSLKCHLTYNPDLAADLQNVLQPHELQALLQAQHKPNYVARVISEIISTAKLTPPESFLMDANLTFFADAVGGSERIFKTPIPLSWTRHTSRFLVIWLAFLPFTLYGSCRWATVPISAIISLLLLGIEEIGVQIEEPFSILPLDNICTSIAGNVKEMHAQRGDCEDLVQRQISSAGSSPKGLPAGSPALDVAELETVKTNSK